MKFSWIVGVGLVAACGVVAADPALARGKHHKAARHCIDRTPAEPTLYGFFFNPPPQPNGCTPPVFAGGHFVGQDPDPYIRQQLHRDPRTGDWYY